MRYVRVEVSKLELNGKMVLEVRFNRRISKEVANLIKNYLAQELKTDVIFTVPHISTIDEVYYIAIDGLEFNILGKTNFGKEVK